MSQHPELPVAAAIDIGSNSIKMTIARMREDGALEQIGWASEVARLGQGIDQTGRLDEDRMDAAIAALTRFVADAKEAGAKRILAVATEATRAAANGEAFLQRVREETGVPVRVIDGDEEANLTFRGLSAVTNMTGRVVIADIGGGSTELIVANDGVMLGARSVPLGSGRLTDRLIDADPPTADELASAELEAEGVIQRAARSLKLPRGGGARLIIVGGTGEFMARLVPDEHRIDRKTIKDVLGKMAVLTAAELADCIEAPEARARVLPAGVAVVSAIANRVLAGNIEIARSGVRTGLLLEAFADRAAFTADSPGDQGQSVSERSDRVEEPSKLPEPDFREAMKTLIAQRWAVVWKTIPVALEGTDIEGVHDVRVASRRLRAAMDIAAPAFPRGWYKPLHRAAKEITGALGEVRDRDVLLAALAAERDAAVPAERPGIERLIHRVDQERIAARVEMERFLHETMHGPLRHEVERRFGRVPEEDAAAKKEKTPS